MCVGATTIVEGSFYGSDLKRISKCIVMLSVEHISVILQWSFNQILCNGNILKKMEENISRFAFGLFKKYGKYVLSNPWKMLYGTISSLLPWIGEWQCVLSMKY